MRDNETQKELLKETVEPTKALEMIVQMEMGAQNQQKINQNLALTTNLVNAVNTFQTRNCNANYQPARKDFTPTHLYPKTISTRVFVLIVANDGAKTIDKFAPRMAKSAIIVV